MTSTEPSGGSGTSSFPAAGTLSSPATLSYGYYPNGWQGVSVSSAALS